MIPFASLPLLAALLLTIAFAVAWWRRRDPATAMRQAGTALFVALAGVVLAALAYGLGRSPAVVHAVERDGTGGEIAFEVDRPLAHTTWLAVRAQGVKPGEVRPPGLELLQGALDYPPPRPGTRSEPLPVPTAHGAPVSAAHTAPVWITVAGRPPLFAQASACSAARAWLSRLADVEYWLSEDAPPEVTSFPGRGDGVPAADLRAHRRALLDALADSRAWLARAGAGTCDGEPPRPPP